MKKRSILVGMVSLVLTSLLLIWCLRQINLQALGKLWHQTNLAYLFGAAALIGLIPLVKTLQWRLFVLQTREVPFRRLFQAMGVRLMMVNLLPSWFGESVSLYWFSRRESFSPMATLSFLSLDHLADTFSLVVVLAVVALFADLPPWMKNGMAGLVAAFLLLSVALLWLARHQGLFARRWGHHLHVLRQWRPLALVLLASLVVKGLAIGSIILVQKGASLNLPLITPFLVIATLQFATMIPVTPANLGVFETVLLFVYRWLGLETTAAFGVGLLCHLVFLLPYVVVGLAAFLLRPLTGNVKLQGAPVHG